MAFPFAFVPGFRQRLILAIGTTSLASAAAFGCTADRRVEGDVPKSPSQTKGAEHTAPSDAAGGGKAMPSKNDTDSGQPVAEGGAGAPAGPAGRGGRSSVSVRAGDSAMTGQAGMSGMAGWAGGSLAQAGVSGMTAQGGAGAAAEPAMCSQQAMPTVQCFTREQMEAQAQFGCAGLLPEPPKARFTDAELATHFLANGCLEHPLSCDGCCNPSVAPGIPGADDTCCYAFCPGACCGRPFVVAGQPRLAVVERRSDWLQMFAASGASSNWDARIASEWLEDARMEHASIASFARFTLDLLAFGAPSELVELAQRAALEEIEHARLCFGLAARYGARECGPGTLAAADVRVAASLWHAAVAAFEEGCVAETLAALQAQAALEAASDPEVQRVLAQIAQQEAAHAELAWRFVSWSVARLGPQLTRELERRYVHLSAIALLPEYESAEAVAALHAAGRLTGADRSRVAHSDMQEIVPACLAALSEVSRTARSGPRARNG